MDSRRALRVLIVTEIAMAAAAVIAALVEQRFLPEPLRHWLEQDAERPLTTSEIVFAVLIVPLFGALVVSWIGLWRLWKPARRLYLFTVACGMAATLLTGPQVSSAIGSALSTAASMATGAIIALVYFSPLSVAFERPRAAPPGGFDVTMNDPAAASEGPVAG